MGGIGYATLSVIPSAKGFGSALSRDVGPQMGSAGKEGGKKFGSGMLASAKSFAAPLAGLFAVGAGVAFFKSAIAGASDLSESASKVGVVFGKQSAQIMASSKTSAAAMGLSSAEYLAANGTLGNLLVSLKVAPKAAADMSQQMVGLAGDLASFNNVPIADALAAIQSGLTGETEPLKRFGVNMNDATLKAQALKLGLIKSTKDAMSPQTKALAAQALIMAQTGTAQGDFARTSGGLANQQRILGAQFADVKTKIGAVLLPIMTKLVTFLNAGMGPAFTTISGGFRALAAAFQAGGSDITSSGFAGIMERIGLAGRAVIDYITGTVVPGVRALVAAFMAGGSDVTSSGFAGGMERVGLVARSVADFITGKVIPAFVAVGAAVLATVMFFVQHQNAAIALGVVVGGVLAVITAAWVAQGVVATINAVKSVLAWLTTATAATTSGTIHSKSTAQIVVGWLAAAAGAVISAAVVVAGWVATAAGAVASGVVSAAVFVANGVRWVASGVVAMANAAIVAAAWLLSIWPIALVIAAVVGLAVIIWKNMGTIKAWIGGAWNWIKSATSAAWNWIKSTTSAVWGAIAGFFSSIGSRISGAISAVIGVIKTVFSYSPLGLVVTHFGEIISFFQSLPAKIMGVLSGAGSWLLNVGGDIVRGLISGIGAMAGAVGHALLGLLPGPLQKFANLLGIHSPSKVFAGFGMNIGQGLIVGMDGTRPAVAASMTGLVSVPSVGSLDFASPSARASAVNGTSGADVVGAIQALGDRFGDELQRQARTIQTMQRQMAGAR